MPDDIFFAVSVAVIWFVVRVIACVRIYDSAKSRGMKAGCWALAVVIVLIPTLMLFYIVRKEKVEAVCQNCGKVYYDKKRFCAECSAPIEKRNENKINKSEKILFVFSIVLAVVASVLIATFLITAFSEKFVETVELEKEEVQKLHPEVYSWIEDCDKDENNDVFIMESDYSLGLIVYIKGWVECTDCLDVEVESDKEETKIKILLPEKKSEDKDTYNITYIDTVYSEISVSAEDIFVYSGDKMSDVKITKNDADYDLFASWYVDVEDLSD